MLPTGAPWMLLEGDAMHWAEGMVGRRQITKPPRCFQQLQPGCPLFLLLNCTPVKEQPFKWEALHEKEQKHQPGQKLLLQLFLGSPGGAASGSHGFRIWLLPSIPPLEGIPHSIGSLFRRNRAATKPQTHHHHHYVTVSLIRHLFTILCCW